MDNNNPPQFRGGPFFDGGGHHGGAGGLGWVIFALQLLMLAALAVLLVRAFAHRGPRGLGRRMGLGGRPDPLSFAQMRYARGELSRDEYQQLTKDLAGQPAPPVSSEPT